MTAKPTRTEHKDGSVTESYKLSEMNVEQLTMLSQAVGRKIDALRDQRADLKKLIDAKLAKRNDAIAQIAKLQASLSEEESVDGTAPGAVIEASASKD